MQCKSINVFFVYHCGNRCCVTHIFVVGWGGGGGGGGGVYTWVIWDKCPHPGFWCKFTCKIEGAIIPAPVRYIIMPGW